MLLAQHFRGERNDAVGGAANRDGVVLERDAHHAAAHDQPADLARIPSAGRDQIRDARAESHFEIARSRDGIPRHGGDAAHDGLGQIKIAIKRSRGAHVLAEVTDVRRLGERRHFVSRELLDELTLAAGGIHRRHRHDGEPLLRVERG